MKESLSPLGRGQGEGKTKGLGGKYPRPYGIRRDSPLGAGVLVEDPAHHADLAGVPVLVLEGDDVARIDVRQRVGAPLVRDHLGLAAREVRAQLGFASDPQAARGRVHRHDAVAIVLERVGQAHTHEGPPFESVSFNSTLLPKAARRFSCPTLGGHSLVNVWIADAQTATSEAIRRILRARTGLGCPPRPLLG